MTFWVEYKMHSADAVKGLCIGGRSKAEAYDRAVYEAIPNAEGQIPYSAWVASVTYQNGNYRTFNTFEGNPY